MKLSEDILIFIDETGHEELADPNFPVFGLAGCLVVAKEYDSVVKQPWQLIYAEHFDNRQEPLHACEAQAYTSKQKEAIGEFFKKQPFVRIATVTCDKAKLPTELFRYQAIAGLFEAQLRQILQAYEFNSVAMIFESCERTDRFAKQYFSDVRFLNKEQKEVSAKRYFVQKSKNFRGVSGLEVVDFIVNAAGGRTQARRKGNENTRQDFQCVFTGVHWHPVGFRELGDMSFDKPLVPELRNRKLTWTKI